MTDQTSNPSKGLLLSSDLIFISKVTGTASMLKGMIRVVANETAVMETLKSSDGPFHCLLIDLETHTTPLENLIQQVKSLENPPTVIAFGPHVYVARLQNARDAGCDQVMPRSRFSSSLPELLQKFLIEDK